MQCIEDGRGVHKTECHRAQDLNAPKSYITCEDIMQCIEHGRDVHKTCMPQSTRPECHRILYYVWRRHVVH